MRNGCRRTIWIGIAGLVAVMLVVRVSAARADDDAAKPAAAASILTAPAVPQVVVQGGAIPKDWVPTPVPYSGIGPDGRPITVHVAPTYTFTYPIGPPVPVATAQPRAAAYRPPVAAAPASVPYGSNWVFRTQGLNPADAGTLVAKPYELPARPTTWAAAPFPATPPSPQQYGGPLQPPPQQWIPAQADAPPPMAPAAPPSGEVLAAIAPAAIAGGAAAAAANPAPQPIPTSPQSQSTTAQSASLSPLAPPQSEPLVPVQSSAASGSNSHFWRVVGVHDGDTVTCIDDTNTKQKVRLAEIDAPEASQDFGQVSRNALADMVFGKTVEVRDEGKDRYGRWIGHLYVDNVDVNRQMVATGNAWHYAAYSKDQSLADLQSQAQARRIGLWAQPSPTPPWEYRRTGSTQGTTTQWDRRNPLREIRRLLAAS